MSKSNSGESGYQKLLRDPRWQKRRLEVLSDANWSCEDAGCGRTDTSLEVHHCYYIWGTKPWDYPRDALIALCEECHDQRYELEKKIKIDLLRCLRDVPIRRLEVVSRRLFQEALKEAEVST